MDRQAVLAEKQAVASKYGDWYAHNIQLRDDIYTIGPRIVGDEIKLRRIVQCVQDHAGGSVEGLRILDLACGEGLYGIEFARQKAACVAIEGREPNIHRMRFVKSALSLNNLEIVQDDVRNLSVAKYGEFDVVLCLGILYHLKTPDVFAFVEKLGEVCRKVCIVDTRVSLHPKTSYAYNGSTYFGTPTEEHWPGDSTETKLSRIRASLDNEYSVWLSRPSIYNLLSAVGFTSVYECHVPAEPKKPGDRITFVAIKGRPCELLSAPLMATEARGEMLERPLREVNRGISALRSMSHALPWRVRRLGKRALGLEDPLL
jgi:2-polyprenyl-3-methyl-5-hydroxy-6-metoxy-1,4-benzoquinol methylase